MPDCKKKRNTGDYSPFSVSWFRLFLAGLDPCVAHPVEQRREVLPFEDCTAQSRVMCQVDIQQPFECVDDRLQVGFARFRSEQTQFICRGDEFHDIRNGCFLVQIERRTRYGRPFTVEFGVSQALVDEP